MTKKNDYNINDIKVLKWLDAIRERPWMYVWGKDKKALHHILYEVINNSVDEFIAWYGNKLKIIFEEDWKIIVEDNARGIPIEEHPKYGISVIKLLTSELHAWGKMWWKIYNTSWWLNGVWIKATNALSKYFKITVCRNWEKWSIEYSKWKLIKDLHKVWKCKENWTKVEFIPDDEIFWNKKIDFNEILEYIRKNAYLLPKVKFIIENKSTDEKYTFYWKDIKDLLKEEIENKQKTRVIKIIEWKWKKEVEIRNNKKDIKVIFTFTYVNNDNENILSFVNNIYTFNGWTHVKWMQKWIKKALERYFKNEFKNSKSKLKLIEGFKLQDYLKWLYWVLAIYEQEPDFLWQTKYELNDEFAQKWVEKIIYNYFYDYLKNNKKEWKKIFKKIEENYKLRKKIDDTLNQVKIKKDTIFWVWKGKLKDCIVNDNRISELYIVEWDSAAGTLLLAKDNLYQATLALKGKILNINNSSLNKIIDNNEVKDIINAIGTWIWKQFDISKIRYWKIIINADEDADWKHIQSLLITLFYKLMPELIEKWYIYIVKWPLFSITIKDKKYYFEDEQSKDKFLNSLDENKRKKAIITRFKWLWEMDAETYKETMLTPWKRKLIKVTIEDAIRTEEIINKLMWNDSEYKLKILNEYWEFFDD